MTVLDLSKNVEKSYWLCFFLHTNPYQNKDDTIRTTN